MANSEISTKSEVTNWETVATYVSTFPSDNGEGAREEGSVRVY